MPMTCLVIGCGSRSGRDKVKFYSVPEVKDSPYFQDLNKLSRKRREAWINALERIDLTPSILRSSRVCSRHFITGSPATLKDANNPDWVPSQNMGYDYDSKAIIKRKNDVDVDRKDIVKKIQKCMPYHSAVSQNPSDEATCDTGIPVVHEVTSEAQTAKNVCYQTDLPIKDEPVSSEELDVASQKIKTLGKQVENSPLGLMDDISNVNKWKYYVGFEYEIVHEVIFKHVEPHISTSATTVLSSFSQLLLTLIKLRLNLDFEDLAYRFKIALPTASRYFQNVINILYESLKCSIIWPEDFKKNIPLCFIKAFPEKPVVIVDCFEVFIEKPEKHLTQQQCWSNYKHHHTVKFLIGIAPQGTICYISKAWGGSTSDKQMLELNDFCKYIKPTDIVLAGGFFIQDTSSIMGPELVKPAFTKVKDQLHPIEVENTKDKAQDAQVRIYVEQLIGMIKNKFKILNGTIPISMLRRGSDEEVNLLDKIVTINSALVNLSPPIMPL